MALDASLHILERRKGKRWGRVGRRERGEVGGGKGGGRGRGKGLGEKREGEGKGRARRKMVRGKGKVEG